MTTKRKPAHLIKGTGYEDHTAKMIYWNKPERLRRRKAAKKASASRKANRRIK